MRYDTYVTTENLNQRSKAWLEKIRAAIAPRPHLVIDPRRCALLVIDMMRHFADPKGRSFLPTTQTVTPNISKLLMLWRENGWTIGHTQHANEGEHDRGMLGKFFTDYIRVGEPDAEIIKPLTPEKGEIYFRKTTYDAFLNTCLEKELRDRGIEQVLITGVFTHMCCEASARSAFDRGFEVFVAADATATTTEERHLQSLLAMGDTVAIIMSTAEIEERCAENKSSS